MFTPLNARSVELAGKSGEKYLFTVWLRETRFHARAGVYIMARWVDEERFEMIYIGEHRDMSARPLNADRLACFNQHGVDHIFTCDETDQGRRSAMVADLVSAINPICNRQ